jgi:hypothetical protein
MSEGHAYTVPMIDQTIAANATLVIIHTASALTSRASRIEILGARCSQAGTATAQMLGIELAVKASAFGTYTSTAPVSLELGGTASGIAGGTAGAAATAGTDASAEGGGTVTVLFSEGFNNLAGWLYVPVPEERPNLGPDQAIILKLIGTPTTLTNWHAVLVFRELN